MVDINSKDANEWLNISKNQPNVSYEMFEKSNSRMYRFKNAFNNFFADTGLVFDRIDDSKNNTIDIVFKRNNQTIYIDDLSTGEKQIVFRGATLLRNRNKLEGGLIFIDEPELSLHPIWQTKILDFYKNIFTINGRLNTQIFFATHSENVLGAALMDKEDCLVIVLNNNSGEIASRKITAPYKLNSITLSEINYLAFNLYTIDYHIQLYAKLQEKYSTQSSISDTDVRITQEPTYDPSKHSKQYAFNSKTYSTLPTFIRNCIDHPGVLILFLMRS